MRRGDTCSSGDEILGVGRSEHATPQIDDAARNANEKRVWIPIALAHTMCRFGPCKALGARGKTSTP